MWLPFQLLSVTLWAVINVLDSLLVRRYKKHPVSLLWSQSVYSIGILLCLAAIFPVRDARIWLLLAAGIFGYLGDLVFFVTLKFIDVSITNVTWVILSVFLALCGLYFLGESWTEGETVGVVLILTGILLLSLWQQRRGEFRFLFFLPLLALLYTPFYLIQKISLLGGSGVVAVFFWSLLGRECLSFFLPLIVPPFRKHIFTAFTGTDATFPLLNGTVVALFFFATYLTAKAFETGPVSLVGVVGNIQPFLVLLLSWLVATFLPTLAPKELLEKRAVLIKLISFFLAFFGLALLAASQ